MSNPTKPQVSPLKKLIALSLLIALSVVFERLLGYNDKIINVSFGYLPIALVGLLFGPIAGLIAGALGDFLGALIFPIGPINPLFVVMGGLQGLCYGIFLHHPQMKRSRVLLCQLIITLVLHIVLNTLILVPIIGKSFLALVPLRAFKNALFFPIEIFTLFKLYDYRATFERHLR